MDKKKLKHLIHERKKNDPLDQLDGSQIPFCQLKEPLDKAKKNGTLNIFRIKTLTKLRNEQEYEYSDHIRLKPYFEVDRPVMWQGIISHVTTPNASKKPVGDILIDKVEFGGIDQQVFHTGRPIDYHLWLQVANIRMMAIPPIEHKQKVSIGDVIQGFSLVKEYGHGKYGLGSTVITAIGVPVKYTKGADLVQRIISDYDRGDDWSLELQNSSNITDKVNDNLLITDNVNDNFKSFDELRGHVDVRYQPARYDKYFERLETNLEAKKNYQIIDKHRRNYAAGIKDIRPVIRNGEYKLEYELKNIWITNGYRLSALVSSSQKIDLPVDLIVRKDQFDGVHLRFKAKRDSEDLEKLADVEDVTFSNYPQTETLPADKELLLGYYLFKDRQIHFTARPILMKYLAWAYDHNQNRSEIRSYIDGLLYSHQLIKQEDMANKLLLDPDRNVYTVGEETYVDNEVVLDLSRFISEDELEEVEEEIKEPAKALPAPVEKPALSVAEPVKEKEEPEADLQDQAVKEQAPNKEVEYKSPKDLQEDLATNERVFIGSNVLMNLVDKKGQVHAPRFDAKAIPLPSYKKLRKTLLRSYVTLKAVMPESSALKKLRQQGIPVQELGFTGKDLAEVAQKCGQEEGIWLNDQGTWRFSAEIYFLLLDYFKKNKEEFEQKLEAKKAKQVRSLNLLEKAKQAKLEATTKIGDKVEELAKAARELGQTPAVENKEKKPAAKPEKTVIKVAKKPAVKQEADKVEIANNVQAKVRIITANGSYFADDWTSLKQAQAELAKLAYRTNPSFIAAHDETTNKAVLLAPSFVQLIEEI